jgi:nickel-dependent lactate racemase
VNIELPYDGTTLEFELEGRSNVGIAGERFPPSLADSEDELLRALGAPVRTKPLEEILPPEGAVSVLISDMTRGGAVRPVLSTILRFLEERGAGPERSDVFIATGAHRGLLRSELKEHLGEEIMSRWRVHQHNADNDDALIEVGTTPAGTTCIFNERVAGSRLVIVIGTISFHYFAGFGGGRKLILPGIAGRDSILSNHKLSLSKESTSELADGCASGNLEGNPVHEDMLAAAKLLEAPLFAVNVIPGRDDGISFVNAGEIEFSHIEACERYRELFTIDLERKYGAVIVSAGGSPKDVNLLQAHKALRHASTALEEGGVMLAALACAGGVGSDSLDMLFEKGRSRVPGRVRKGYTLNTQTAVSMYELTGRFSIYLRSMMKDSDISRFGFCPWKKDFTIPLLESYADEDILVMPNAPGFLFRAADESAPVS